MSQSDNREERHRKTGDDEVTLPLLVAALIGRTLRRAGCFEVTWEGAEVRARHCSGDRVVIWVLSCGPTASG